MINAQFYRSGERFSGFRISGHAGYAEAGHDVACASVSSAVQLMINLLDVLGFSPEVKISDNVIKCIVKNPANEVSVMFSMLRMHFQEITEEFPETINITISEV